MIRTISLGAGVQSTLVDLWSLNGTLPPIDAAIFADTGWEPAEVYEHVEKLKVEHERAGVPLVVVSKGDIRKDHLEPEGEHLFIRNPTRHPERKGRQRIFIPFYVANGEEKGIVHRLCTKTYKIEPVEKQIRSMLGLVPYQNWPTEHVVDQVFGISYDESHRMKDSRRGAIVNHYPLVDMKITRADCHRELAKLGWTAPRSACIGCPYHRNDEWRHLRDDKPDEWADAVEFDHEMRRLQATGRLPIDGVPYLHDKRLPLDEVNIDDPDEDQLSLFGDECEGMCGV